MITAFVNFELWENAAFTTGAYVFKQIIGLPIARPMSAQLAVLYLMCAEMRTTKSALSALSSTIGELLHLWAIW